MVYVACRPANCTRIWVGDAEELAEVAWRQLDDLDALMPAGVFGPFVEHLQRVLS
jgi:hypothetical protein